MNWTTRLASIGIAAAAASLTAQETPPPANTTQTQTQTQTTTEQRHHTAATGTTSISSKTKTPTVSGEVVRYEPGRTIVIRDPNSRTVTYMLDGGLTVPADVQVGRKVTIYSSPGDGSMRVQRITTVTSATAGGAMTTKTVVSDEAARESGQMTTQSSQESPARADGTTVTTTTKTTRVSGTVRAYEPGQSITILGPGNKVTTYTVTTDSQLPVDVAVGKQVTIQTSIMSGKPVVRSVTYRTTTKTTQSKTVSPQ